MEVSEKGLRAGLAITQGELGEPPPRRDTSKEIWTFEGERERA